jgi:hypothetical protein
MAGDWLKMRHDLADDPSVIRVAADLSIDEDLVIGKLFRLWSWADRHTTEGQAEGIGMVWVDRLTRCEGFGAALERAGWLEKTAGGLLFPRFHRHCSDTAKARALASDRMKRSRCARSATEAQPEKRREREEVPPPPREASLEEAGQGDPWPEFREAWNKGAGIPWTPPTAPDGWEGRVAVPGWLEEARKSLERLGRCKFFVKPVGLPQFIHPRFVGLCNAGQYDTPKPDRSGKGREPEKQSAEEYAKRWGSTDPIVAESRKAIAEKKKTLLEGRA